MRNFIFDVWVWSKAKHSRLLKQIRVKALSFPSDMFCLNEAAKDADVLHRWSSKWVYNNS